MSFCVVLRCRAVIAHIAIVQRVVCCACVVWLVRSVAFALSSLCVGERDERGSGGRAPRPEWLRAERHEAERCSERSDLRRGTQAKAQAPRRGRAPGTAARAAAAAYLRNKGRPSGWTSVHISSLSRWRGRSGPPSRCRTCIYAVARLRPLCSYDGRSWSHTQSVTSYLQPAPCSVQNCRSHPSCSSACASVPQPPRRRICTLMI